MNAIDIKSLGKSYDGEKYALKDVSLSIPEGEIFGFLGPNGAGKTTMVRLLNGILTPTEGEATILGRDVKDNLMELRSLCGVITETAALYENLTGTENLNFFGNLYGMKTGDIDKRSRELLKSLDLFDAKDRKVKAYSTGMKKRMALARALLPMPRILFLDEPTSGLDPEASLNVTKMIRDLSKEQGVTVFLCTHQLKYAEEICTLYGFIHRGKLLGSGRFQELLRERNSSVFLEIRGENLPPVKNGETTADNKLRVPIENDSKVPEILQGILSGGGKVYEARQVHWSLEDLYFSFQKEDVR